MVDLAIAESTSCPSTSSSTSTSANLKYVLTDVAGSGRALMNNGGTGSSTIATRHDYLPFGEEIWAGVGLRTNAQKYATTDKVRNRFAMTERDEATGLDHTWFRKYESFAGRWTSPDPYGGSMKAANPQSFNRYSYVLNDPVNLIDPTGLFCVYRESWDEKTATLTSTEECYLEDGGGGSVIPRDGGGGGGGGLGGVAGDPGAQNNPQRTPTATNATPDQQRRFDDAFDELWKRLHANNGDNSCANFFGGIKDAEKQLKGTKWSFGTPERPAVAQVKGDKVIIDPTGAFMDTSGSTNIDVGWYIDPRRTPAIVPKTITLNNVEAAAFFLLHELAHRTKSFGDRDNDAGLAGYLNNDDIRKACFPEARVSN